MARYFASVDGGASKTVAIIVDERGQEVGRGNSTGSNYQALGLEKALASVHQAMTAARAQAGADLIPEVALLGLSGLDRPADIEIWQKAAAALPLPLAQKLHFSNDAELILGALPGRVGLGLICGTGSISVGCDSSGKKARAGGWGHYFGDEGSGLWLGREALRAASKMADGRGPKTVLLDYILKEWNLVQPEGIIGQVYTEPRPDNARIARLSHLVFLAADDGDTVSLNLVNRAAAELAQIVRAVYQKLTFPEPPSLAIAGGIIINSPRLVGQLERVLKHHMPVAGFVPVPEPALAAARAFVG